MPTRPRLRAGRAPPAPEKPDVLAHIPPGRLVDILDFAEDGVVTTDAGRAIVLFNRGAARLFGYAPEEVLGRPIEVLIPERFRAGHPGQVAGFASGPVESRLMADRREVAGRRKDGTEFPAEISISKLAGNGELLFTAIIRDVTERRRLEAARVELEQLRARAELKDTRAKLDALVAAARDGVVILDGAGRVTFLNPAAERLFATTDGAAVGRPVAALLGAGFAIDPATEPGPDPVLQVVIPADGRLASLEVSRTRVYDDNHSVWLLIVRDATERVRTEAALRESEARLRLFIENAPTALAMFDRDMRYLAVSRRWQTDYKLGDADLRGRLHYAVFPEIPAAWREAHARALAGEVVRADEDRFVRPDGGVQWVRWEVRPWRDAAGAVGGVVMFTEDITDRKRAEEALRDRTEELRTTTQQLWQAARLAGVGELAASIAHELNNPLGTVALRVEGVLARTPPEDPRRRPLEVIEQEVERMAGLVGNLLSFSRAGRDQVSTVNVAEELTRTAELVGHHLRKHRIRVEAEFDPGVSTIQADRQQLRQVFLNLFTNAADAMPGGGTLKPRVGRGTLPEGGAAVVVEVSDTGAGIPPELLPKVCDPFFTTKDEGKGTGLGLAICRRIVQQHHGTLDIASGVGHGTTVRITLPVRPDTNVAGLKGT